MKGKVYLIEVGSGDPDLLSAKAQRMIRSAEVVLHSDHVSPEILELTSASSQVRNIHKLGLQAAALQDKIHSLLISAARDGHQVVWLEANDQLLSAHAASETAEALAQAGVDFEVVSGTESTMGAVAGANSR